MQKKKIGIIGGGNMGRAMYMALLENSRAENLFVVETALEKIPFVKTGQGYTDPNDVIPLVDILILAVKPQSFSSLAKQISVPIGDKLIISIMAGVAVSQIQHHLHAKHIIRAMPNLAITVQQGMIGWYGSSISEDDHITANHIFSSMGMAIEVATESQLDWITALSGSGPAYFFYLTELLASKAEKEGFSESDARLLAEQTLIGTASLLNGSHESARDLRKAVTSRGGTTEAALNILEDHNFSTLFFEALTKAKDRAVFLSEHFDNE